MATSLVTLEKPYSMYVDDSGKKSTELVFVGGWLARSERWEQFQKKWIPKVTKRGKKEFKRSSYNQKLYGNDFLFELEDMIRDHTLYGFANGIYCEDWRRVADKYAMELYHLVPFSICARTCIGMVREWCSKHDVSREYMAYFMDKGSEDSGELTQLLNIDMSQEVRDVTVIPDDSKRIAAIQAADFLSWEIRNQYLVNPDPQDWNELTPMLAQLIRGRIWALSSVDKIPKVRNLSRGRFGKTLRQRENTFEKGHPARCLESTEAYSIETSSLKALERRRDQVTGLEPANPALQAGVFPIKRHPHSQQHHC